MPRKSRALTCPGAVFKSALTAPKVNTLPARTLSTRLMMPCSPVHTPISACLSLCVCRNFINVTMMKFLQTQSDKHALIGVCMGEQGIISRVLSVRAGSVFTFGAVNADLKTAPGQVSARDLRGIYRIEQIGRAPCRERVSISVDAVSL